MSIMLHRIGILEQSAGGGGGGLEFVGGGDTVITSGTSVSPTFPAGIQAGDEAFAIIVRRGTVTLPADWTLVAEQKNQNDNFTGTHQWTSIYRKTYEVSDGSDVTFTQDVSSIMNGHVVAIRPTGGVTVTVADTATGQFKQNSSGGTGYGNHNIPGVTATKDGEIGLAGSSCLQSDDLDSSGAVSYIKSPDTASEHTQTTPEDIASNRFCVTTKVLDAAEVFNGHHRHEGSIHRGGEVSLLISWSSGGSTEPNFANVVLLLDNTKRGEGTDANFANVVLLLDNSKGS